MRKLDLCMARASSVETHGFMFCYCFDEGFLRINVWKNRMMARRPMEGGKRRGECTVGKDIMTWKGLVGSGYIKGS
jgi:hypothetical protein